MCACQHKREAGYVHFLLSPFSKFIYVFSYLFIGTFVIEVNATDADDATYGNSAKLVYSILQGQPYFSVDPETGESSKHLVENIFSADKLL